MGVSSGNIPRAPVPRVTAIEDRVARKPSPSQGILSCWSRFGAPSKRHILHQDSHCIASVHMSAASYIYTLTESIGSLPMSTASFSFHMTPLSSFS